MDLLLVDGLPSMMSYDHPGSIGIAAAGALNLYDQALYLYTYADSPDPDDDDFAAYGTVTDCATGDPLYGAAVFALEGGAGTTVTPVNLSMTGLHPLGAGEFRLEHLDRLKSYRLLVADARDPNQMKVNGWTFEDEPGGTPGLGVSRTDLWDEDHAGDAYSHAILADFATGFDLEVTAAFDDTPGQDYDADTICVDF